eukprot:CAMPEP_0202688350 /NCGR_PEP_ID=MMETSP1385-20130828/3874_1 /ASSEMBLY_ACC=CAM_ASM_000861 /TAXON_ID=933848 /ORGANISM="Elphidium margaritaceum" /LENGTH=1206 /DNA_ID=CAMNT_0049343303 /DNA_START=94 /DNA_END=3714 /DNA_ORIENTATION=-
MNVDIESSDEEEELLIEEHIRHAPHSPPRKRRRLTGGQVASVHTSPDTDSSTDKENHSTYTNDTKRKRRRPSAATQVPHANGTSMAHPAAFPSTQPIQQRIQNFGSKRYNIPINVNPGAIVRLELQNFLCHDNFNIAFHPNVNIIYGANGSGKSAIEAGISMALGTGAKKSGRGNNLNDVIKFGKERAIIRIHLFNRGAEALPKYGDEIVIERTITKNKKNGNSTFKVCDSQLHVVAKGARAVREICERLNINVENPCVVLKQSTAKEFLNSTKPADKFKFFMQSSKLGDYQAMLEEAKYNVNVALQQQIQTKGSFTVIKEQFEDCQRQYQHLLNHEAQTKKVEHYVTTEKWMRYHSQMEGLARFEADEAQCENTKKEWQRKLAARTDKLKQDMEKLLQVKTGITESHSSLSQYEEPIAAHKAEQRKLDEKRADICRRISAKQKFIDQSRRKLKNFQRELQQCLAEMANDDRGRQLAEIEQQLSGSKERLEQLRTQQEPLQEQSEKTIEMKQNEDELLKLQQSLHYQQRERDQIRNDFQQLSRNQNRDDWFTSPAHGKTKVHEIQAEIERNRSRFSRPPIGPLGAHVEMYPVDDPDEMQRRIHIVQAVLGRNMSSFLVHSSRDQSVLKDLMRRKFNITINCLQFAHSSTPFRVHANPFENFRVSDAHGPLIRVLDMFHIRDNNAWIYNALVTASNPERQFAHGTLSVAKNFLSGLDEHRLRRVACVYTFREPNGLFRVSKKKSSISGTPITQHRPILQSDTKQQQQWLHQRLNEKQDEIHVAEQRVRALQMLVNQHNVRLKEALKLLAATTRQIKSLENKIGTWQRRKSDLQEEQEDNDEMQTRMSELNNNIDDEKVSIANVEEELAPYEQQREEVLQQLNNVKREMSTFEHQVQDAKHRHQSLRTQYQEMAAKLKKDKINLDKIPVKIQELETRKNAINQEWNTERTKCEELKSAAQETGDEVTPQNYPRNGKRAFSLPALQKERKKMQDQIAAYAQESAPPEDVRRRFLTIKPKYETHQKRVQTTNHNVDQLQLMCKNKRKELEAMKQEVQKQLSKEFALIMRTQGHNGKLKVDFEAQELDMEVHMKSHDGGTRVVNTRTLSGGERSFSQVALIMALQKFSGSPMCIYDEFDVFMDSVNRCNSIKILLKAALGCDPSEIQKKNATLRPSDRQYLFITPNDISPMLAEGSEDLMSIHQLNPPRKA